MFSFASFRIVVKFRWRASSTIEKSFISILACLGREAGMFEIGIDSLCDISKALLADLLQLLQQTLISEIISLQKEIVL